MDPETEKIIKEQMEKLPAEIRNLFTDPGLGDKILNIGRKNGIINIEQLGVFQTETNLMMLGLVHPDEYPKELKDRLKIDDIKVDNIINDINTQILSGIREKLKEVYNKVDEPSKDEEEKPTESREELLRKIPARSVFSTADAGGETPTILNTEKPADMVSRLESEKELPEPAKGEAAPSILEQKLSGSFQIPNVETEHTLNNISKDSGVSTKPKVGIPKVDPYREIPE